MGTLKILEEVVVETHDEHEVLVLRQAPACRGETFTLELVGSGGSLSLAVRVVTSAPVMIEGAVRHRVRLEILEKSARSKTGPTGGQPFSDGVLVGDSLYRKS